MIGVPWFARYALAIFPILNKIIRIIAANGIFSPCFFTSGTAEGGGATFKNKKYSGEVVCFESWMAEGPQ